MCVCVYIYIYYIHNNLPYCFYILFVIFLFARRLYLFISFTLVSFLLYFYPSHFCLLCSLLQADMARPYFAQFVFQNV